MRDLGRFAKRGLGYSAIQGTSASRSDGTQAFDTHPDCASQADVDPDSISRSVREGNTLNANLKISNVASPGADRLTWEITVTTSDCATPSDLSWVTLSDTSGTVPGDRHDSVQVRFNSAGIDAPATVTGKLSKVARRLLGVSPGSRSGPSGPSPSRPHEV